MSNPPGETREEESEASGVEGWRPFARRLLRWTEHFFAAIGALFVLYALCFDLSYVVTPSMSPTLKGGDGERPDWVLTEKISGWFCRPARWDVMTFRDRNGMQLMKRVVGLPGETVSLPDVAQLHINGKKVERPERLAFLQYLPAGNLTNGRSVATGDGWYVLGDQIRDSLDSRFEGPVPKSQIVGHAWLRIWPPSRFGVVR